MNLNEFAMLLELLVVTLTWPSRKREMDDSDDFAESKTKRESTPNKGKQCKRMRKSFGSMNMKQFDKFDQDLGADQSPKSS
jgi:hypothetical protein